MSDPRETSFYVDPTKRSIVLPGLAADKFYSLAVRGYRRVDADINASGVIFSELTRAKSWRYQPSATVSFSGDITGTIQGVSTTQVIADIKGMTDDGVLSRVEKQQTVLLWSNIHSQWDAASSKANQLGGLDSYVASAAAAINALDNHLATLAPAWNDLGKDTQIDPATFQASFALAQAQIADLTAMTVERASQLASWSGIKDDDGKKPEDGATKGAVVGVDVWNEDGTIYVPSVAEVDMEAIREEVDREVGEATAALNADVSSAKQAAADARAEAAKVRTDLAPEIAAARKAGTDASSEAANVRDNLTAEVARARSEEGTLSTRIATAQGRADGAHAAITEETIQRAAVDTALSNKVDTVEAKLSGAQDSELAARIRAEETARVNAVSAVAARTSAIETSARSSGNMVPNSDLATLDGWTVNHNGIGATPPRIRSDADYWIPRGESVLYTDRPGNNGNTGNYLEVLSAPFAVQPGTWLQFYALTASHRQRSWISLFLYSKDGSWHSCAGENYGARVGGGGPDLAGWDTTGLKAFQVPAGALQARFVWRVYGVNTGEENGVAWMFRPFVGLAREGQMEWAAYSPGSTRPQTVTTNARIATEETARSTADTALANRLTTTEAKLSGSQDSELAARIRSEETARVNADASIANRVTSVESRAKRADGFASGDLVRKGTFDDGTTGDWNLPTITPTDHGQIKPPYNTHALHMIGLRDQYESNEWITGDWGGKSLRISGWASCQFSNYDAAVGVNVLLASGSLTWLGVRAADAGVASYNHFDGAITLPNDAIAVRPWIQNNGPPGADRMEVRVASLSIREATSAMEAIAKVSEEATARTNADTAIANRVAATEAKLSGAQDSEIAARIRSEETARTNADSALANRSTMLESQMAGSAGSALKTLIQNNRPNLADVSWWKKGAAIPWGFNSGSRNEIVEFPHGPNFDLLPMPDGSSGDAWLCQAGPGGQAGGGWNTGQIAPLDPDKTYRFIVPIAQLGGQGTRTAYWGTGSVCDLNTANDNVNPYFAIVGSMTPNRWHLFVGYLFPRNSGGKTNAGAGVFDMVTGAQVAQGTNFCFHPDGRQPIHRAYQYYAYEGSYQAFGRPIIEAVDGSETPFPVLSTYARNLAARITTEETTRTAADSALANRATTIEAKLDGAQDSTLAARIRDEATARVNADSSLASRATSLETSMSRVPETWRVKAAGNGASRPANFGDVGLYQPDGGKHGGYTRSYTVLYFQDGNNVVENGHAFDLYGDPNAPAAMASYLNNIPAGRTVVIYTADEPFTRRHTNGLLAAMRNVGAGDAFESVQFRTHSAYVLIGKAGAGRGNGMEYYAGASDIDPLAWLDIPFTMVNGRAVIGGQAGSSVTSARLDDEIYVRSTADAALSGRASTIEAKLDGSQDSTLAARIRDEAAARATADDAIANRTATLESSARGSGNLLSNTSFATRDGWQTGNNPNNWGIVEINGNGDDWRPAGENALSINEYEVHPGNFVEVVSDQFSVTPGEWIQFYCRTSNHRCNTWVSLYFYGGASPAYFEYAGENYSPNRNNGGRSIGGWDYTGLKKIKVPAGATGARMVLRKYATIEGGGHSVAWFTRPFVGPVTDKTDSWMPFVAGTDLAGLRGVTAKISDEATTRATQDSALANRIAVTEAQFRGDTDSTIAARIRDEAMARANADGATASRIDGIVTDYQNRDVAVNGRVDTEAYVRSNADGALANRAATLEAQFRGDTDSTIAARIRDEATARTNADSSLAARIAVTEAQFRGDTDSTIAARVRDEATARANADTALATRSSNLEARAGSLESRTGINETAIVDTKNKLAAARLELSAVSPGGRAAVTLRSDNNNGAGVDIEGDVTFKGKLDIQENVGGNIVKISSSKGFQMIAPNGVVFIDLGLG